MVAREDEWRETSVPSGGVGVCRVGHTEPPEQCEMGRENTRVLRGLCNMAL